MTNGAVEAVGAALVVLTALSALSALSAQDTIPAGYGTLKRDDIVVRFATAQLEIQVLPLDEQVIRLLAPDTYRSLTQLLESQRAALDSAARRAALERPVLVMVTFFGLTPQARFAPEDVNILSRGRLFRPVGVVPLSPAWGTQQLAAREQAIALYVFEDGISVREALTVTYQGLANEAWSRSVRALERERARVLTRTRAQPRL